MNLHRRTDYDKLVLSLTSPMPNEQDFAINVCTLLSNEGRHTLKLAKCPRLLDLLLGHAGVFNHCKYYFIENINLHCVTVESGLGQKYAFIRKSKIFI